MRILREAPTCREGWAEGMLVRADTGGDVAQNDEGLRPMRTPPPAEEGVESAPERASIALADRTRRVLVVDDEEVIRDLLSAVLSERGYAVTTTGTGREAVARLRAEPFDVVVLDYMMPGRLSGAEALAEIRTLRPDCRVVMMTGRPPDEDLVAQLKKADAHFLKPFRCQELLDCLHDLLA